MFFRADACAFALAILAAFPAAGQDWPQFRGPDLDGTASGLGASPPFGLRQVWRRPLGSGYSSISVAGGRGATLFADGGDDYVTAFDARTGEELWRHRIAATYRGHDGSADGPISTPAIAGGTVYALGPRGHLVALDLADGSLRWSHRLDEARAPYYGVATSPLATGDLVVVQTGGGEGRSVTAFDRADGTVRWTTGDDSVSYQSPAVLELLGRRQLVVVGDYFLSGLEPSSGETLWRTRHTEDGKARGGSGLPVALGRDRFAVRTDPNGLSVYEIAEDDGYAVARLWSSDRLLHRSHSAAVFHGGGLFSFDNHFLTRIDPETGARAWKSRPPGGRGLILVDGYLVVLDSKGHVVLAEASPDGYREAARLRVLDGGGWTPPSFAEGLLFVRNLEEMAAVRVTSKDRQETVARQEPRGPIRGLLRELDTAEDKGAAVDRFLARQESFPLIADGGVVDFVYRGAARDVALSGNLTEGFGEELALERLRGTDLFFAELELDPAGHYEYRFHLDFTQMVTDPRNLLRVPSVFGLGSELRMPGWKVPGYLTATPETRGRLVEISVESAILGDTLLIELYLPPGHSGRGGARLRRDRDSGGYPLLVVPQNAGGEADSIKAALDLLVGGPVTPFVAAFLPRLRREHDAAALERYARFLSEELVPYLERRHAALPGPSNRAILGMGGGAPVAVYAAFAAPGTFGKLAVQSFFLRGLYGPLGTGAFSLSPEAQDEILARVRAARDQELVLYVETSVHEYRDPSSGLDARADTDRLLAALRAAGWSVREDVVTGAPGWGSWRARHGRILELFFPSPSAERSPKVRGEAPAASFSRRPASGGPPDLRPRRPRAR